MGSADKTGAGLKCGCEHVRRARCGNTARRDLWRGRWVTGVSTLTLQYALTMVVAKINYMGGAKEKSEFNE
jgi:hypothetical protein